jgi:hypothetical protein
MDKYVHLIERIIQEQENIIGPIAREQAKTVPGLLLDEKGTITLSGDGKKILHELVTQFSIFFGQASVEVCKDVARDMDPGLSSDDLPDILR